MDFTFLAECGKSIYLGFLDFFYMFFRPVIPSATIEAISVQLPEWLPFVDQILWFFSLTPFEMIVGALGFYLVFTLVKWILDAFL